MTASETITALTALANACTPREALTALRDAHAALGENAEAFLPLLECLAGRAREVHQLRQLAGSDELTSISNRRAFRDALDREIARHDRHGGPFAIILLDLDGLKAINDAHGHAVGDEAIVQTARAAGRTLRGCDFIARLGGDEFAILLAGADEEGAHIVAQRVRRSVETVFVAGSPLRISVGVAVAGDEPVSADELFEAADSDLYRDKRGRKAEIAAVGEEPTTKRVTKRPAARASIVRVRTDERITLPPLRVSVG